MDTPCILGSGAKCHGYKHRRHKNGWAQSHRIAWEQANGPIPDGLLVLHRCDNRACVNVDHLFLGTHADNWHDAIAKGRVVETWRKAAKLTAPQIAEIKAARGTATSAVVAKRYAVDSSTVRKIWLGRIWRTTKHARRT